VFVTLARTGGNFRQALKRISTDLLAKHRRDPRTDNPEGWRPPYYKAARTALVSRIASKKLMSLRKILFWIHLTIGCSAGVVVFLMSVTGVLLAYQRQITNWGDRSFRSTPPTPGSQRLPIETIIAGVLAANGDPPSSISLRSGPAAPAEVGFGREHVLLVDMYSGKILGESSHSTRAFFQSVENWHRWLGAPLERRQTARAVTGACNLGFLLLVMSGPFLWLPRKWSIQNVRAVAFFRRGLSGRARDFNWHHVIGIWCALPLFIVVLSGVVMSYPWANNLVYRLTGSEMPLQDNARRGSGPARPRAEGRRRNENGRDAGASQSAASIGGLNEPWKRAEQQVPGWQSITLRLPQGSRGPLAFTIDTGSGGRPDQRSQLTLDRRTGAVIRWEPFSSYNAGRRVRSWLRFLHTGEAGGVAGETVAAIASAGAAILAWTGIWLACRRLWRWKTRRSAALAGTPAVQVTARV